MLIDSGRIARSVGENQKEKWKLNLFFRILRLSITYDVVFDAQASPASAHSASSASILEYDGVGTDELLLFDLQ